MANPQKRRGDRAELEAAKLISALLDCEAERELGAGRRDDRGDIRGVPRTTIQVVHWEDVARALRVKPIEVGLQRLNDRKEFAATFIRLRGGLFRVALTPDQWAALMKEVLK